MSENYDEPTYETGFDVGARENENRTMPIFGAKVGGVNVTNLVEGGKLSSILSLDEKKQVYTQIMYGTTNDLNILAGEIDLIMHDKKLVNEIILNQYNLAIKEIEKEKLGYFDQNMVDRKYQFLATISILKEKGYDFGSLSFSHGEEEVDFAGMLAMFQEQCRRNGPIKDMIAIPIWFRENPPEGLNFRRYNSAMSVVTNFIKEEYARDPDRYLDEWENFRKKSNVERNKNMRFDDYMRYSYRFDINRLDDNLKDFIEARIDQMDDDEVERKKVLMQTLKPVVDTVSTGKKIR